MRIGQGFDVHSFTDGDFVRIGGVDIPHDYAIAAHSDGDVLLHAICDAMLGAVGLGDIGEHFPDTDSRWRGADSAHLTAEVNAKIKGSGWRIGNLDATIIAQRPKFSPHIPAMVNRVADILQIDSSQVSIKATTTERLGFVGREEGIAAMAVVLLAHTDA